MLDGKTLKKIRQKQSMTLGQLADLMEVPESYLKALEDGEKEISPRILGRLLEKLDVDQDSIGKEQWTSIVTENLGDKIRALREQKGLNLSELGTLAGISLTYLSEIERGQVVPSIATLKTLAHVLDVPVSLFINNERKQSLVAEKLKRIRKYKNLSQKELAAKAGVSPGLIGQLETGKVQASLRTIEKLAQALGVSVCALILEQEEVDAIIGALSPELRELLYHPKVQLILGSVCTMDEDKLKLVLNFISMLHNPAI